MNKKLLISTILIFSFVIIGLVNAQTLSLEEINTFDTREGQFTPDNTVDTYIIDIEESQILGVQVLTLSGGLTPEFTVYDADGNAMPFFRDAFGNQQTDRVAFPEPGQYRIEVISAFGTSGDYIINTKTLRPYTPDSIFISDNTMVQDTFENGEEINRFEFSADPVEVSTVIIYGENFEPGIIATLRNQENMEEVGVINSPAMASIYCLPAGSDAYGIEVMRDEESILDSYNISVTTEATSFCDNAEILALEDTLERINADNLLDNTSETDTVNDVTELTSDVLATILTDNTISNDDSTSVDTESVRDALLEIDLSLADEGLTLDVLSNILTLNASFTENGIAFDADSILRDILDLEISFDNALLTVDVLDGILQANVSANGDETILNTDGIFNTMLAIDATLAENGLTVDVLSDILTANASLTDARFTFDLNAIQRDILTLDVTPDELTDMGTDVPSTGNMSCSAQAYEGSQNINVRQLPSVAADVVAVVNTGENIEVLGQSRNGSWIHVRLLDGRIGFASINVLNIASVCASVDLPDVWYDTDTVLTLEVEAGLIDAVDVQADVTVGEDGIIVNADGTVANLADVDANATVNQDGVNVTVDGTGTLPIDGDATVGDDGVDVDVNVGDDDSGVDVDVDIDDDGVDVDVDLGLGG